MIIKVCGMRDAENIRTVEQLVNQWSNELCSLIPLGVRMGWMGFIFWPKSSRYVSERPSYLPTHCKRVGVFVDADIEQIKHTVEDYALDIVQLHGHESPEFLRQLRSVFDHPIAIIKAFNIATEGDLKATKSYEGTADYFLFDTKGQSVGGNGEKFDWSVLDAYDGSTPFLLSGGIGPDDASRVRAFHHPQCIGIDLNSRFEVEPAYKDIKKLKTFLEQL